MITRTYLFLAWFGALRVLASVGTLAFARRTRSPGMTIPATYVSTKQQPFALDLARVTLVARSTRVLAPVSARKKLLARKWALWSCAPCVGTRRCVHTPTAGELVFDFLVAFLRKQFESFGTPHLKALGCLSDVSTHQYRWADLGATGATWLAT